jgi:hypothetical protein
VWALLLNRLAAFVKRLLEGRHAACV